MNILPENYCGRVSVIIPTYNRCTFLPSCIESIINQQYPNIEIIIVDDSSTDNTEATIRELQKENSSIIYLKNFRSKGPSGARNTGILKSTGEFIAFLDSDDIWLEGHLQHGTTILNNCPKIDVLFGDFFVVDFKSKMKLYNFFQKKKIITSLKSEYIYPGVRLIDDNLFVALVKENFFLLGSSITRKSSMLDILLDENIMYAEDRDFAIKLYKEANAIFAYREDQVFLQHRHDSNIYCTAQNITFERNVYLAHIYLFSKYLKKYHLSHEERKLLSYAIAKRNLQLSYIFRKEKKIAPALSYVLKSFKYAFSFSQFKEIAKILIVFFRKHAV